MSSPRKRGRPPGQTAQGAAAKHRLYGTAIGLITRRGYESTTLRDMAKEAGVSVGLLYRYFPSKRAIIIALYDELSADYARQAADMPRGRWRDRFIFALKTSLQVLEPHRVALRALIPVLVGDPDEGVFAESAAFSRLRVQPSIRGRGRWSHRRAAPALAAASAGFCIWCISQFSCGGCSTRAAQAARDRALSPDRTTPAVRGVGASPAAGSTVRDRLRRIDT